MSVPDEQLRLGMGGHQSQRMLKDEWLTPRWIIDRLGPFALDPCAPINRPWPTAARHLTIEDDGLSQSWTGRVWLNPPYGRETGKWLEKLADHGMGTALIFARTETDMFFRCVWERAHSILFLRGRLHFHHVDGTRAKANAGAPSCLVSYSENDTESLACSGIHGRLVPLKGRLIEL